MQTDRQAGRQADSKLRFERHVCGTRSKRFLLGAFAFILTSFPGKSEYSMQMPRQARKHRTSIPILYNIGEDFFL